MSRLPQQTLTLLAIVAIMLARPALAASPQLTGRWGDLRMPEQLVANYAAKKTTALAVVTFSTSCPLARRLVPALNELQQQYQEAGVQFIAVFPNGRDDISAIARYAVEINLAFPVFKDDAANPWHEQLQLKVTPAVVLLDVRKGYDPSRVIYRGQIDGAWAGDGAKKRHRDYLAVALASFVKNEPVTIAETAASGCKIEKRAFHDLSKLANVTYYRDVLPLVQSRCLSCHREGEAGAELFAAFDSYETVAAMSATMLDRIENRVMPPWHAFTSPQGSVAGLKNNAHLSDDEINLFRAWVANGLPAGNAADAPPEPAYADPKAWAIGEPDFVFEMPEPYVVPKDRVDEYQFYRVAANFPEDRYIQAIEMRPGNKAVVHHMGAVVGPAAALAAGGADADEMLTSTQAMLKLYGLTGEQVKKIGDYIAGDPFNARTYPEGYALKLPAHHDLFFEMHYTATGGAEVADVSKMAIRWAPQAPEHLLQTQVFNRKDVRIPPHALHYEKTNYYQFPTDVLIYALAPHMHYRGKDFSIYKVTSPQTDHEQRELIMTIPTYHFGWQRTYELEQPLRLKAGDALYSVTHFDNSHYNPNNPDPEALVRYGLMSEQEMLNVRVKYEIVNFDDEPAELTAR
jgi:thiol-disulfide isomerase/thioredoxin